MRARRLIVALVLAAAVLAPARPALAQCAMCRANVENSAEAKLFSGELNRAILILFFAPYLVFGTFAAFLFRRRIAAKLKALYRSRSGLAASAAAPLPDTP